MRNPDYCGGSKRRFQDRSAAFAVFLDAQCLEDVHQRTEVGEAALEQVCADEGGEPQEIDVDEQRAGLNAQGERE